MLVEINTVRALSSDSPQTRTQDDGWSSPAEHFVCDQIEMSKIDVKRALNWITTTTED